MDQKDELLLEVYEMIVRASEGPYVSHASATPTTLYGNDADGTTLMYEIAEIFDLPDPDEASTMQTSKIIKIVNDKRITID